MTDDAANLLADFTDRLIAGTPPEELEMAAPDGELRKLQDTVLSLYEQRNTESTRVLETRVLSRLGERWDEQDYTSSWWSKLMGMRSRRTAIAMALSVATIVLAILVSPMLPSSDETLPGAALDVNTIPLLLGVAVVLIIGILIMARRGKR